MLNLSPDKQFLIFINEIFDKRRLFAITFFIISITILIIGLLWPKLYESSTTLLWDKAKANALKPLLQGATESYTRYEQTRMAKDVIYSNKNLDILIEKTGLNYSSAGKKLSDREIELLKAQLRRLILIKLNKNKSLRISYKNTDPDLAFLVVSVISNLFADESTLNKKSDSYEAYKFLEKMVVEYQVKLDGITKTINEFKIQNAGLQLDSSQSVNARANKLKEQIKITSQQIKEAIVQKESLTEQLVIESATSILVEEKIVNDKRLVALEYQLSSLRLSYTETYPDIVLIKEQIKNLKKSVEANANKQPVDADTINSKKDNLSSGVKVKSALYQQLQQRLSANETTLRTLSARKKYQEKQLSLELERSGEVNLVLSQLNALSRDREVTKKLYNNLLTKRENSRISLNLENQNKGSLYRIQIPPKIPLVPQGLRFLHFVIGSIFGGVGLPLAIILGLLMIDPRIRHEDEIDSGDAIPIIGVISNFKNEKDSKKQRFATIQSVIIFSLSLIILFTLSLSRYYEVI